MQCALIALGRSQLPTKWWLRNEVPQRLEGVMGQLEKYGLYVLCLVIFLILGVTMWGDPAAASLKQREGLRNTSVVGAGESDRLNQLSALGGDRGLGRTSRPAPDLDYLLGSSPRPKPLKEAIFAGPEQGGRVDSSESKQVASKDTGGSADAPLLTWSYSIKKGDVLGSIAQKQLGSTRFVRDILKLNPGVKAKSIRPGQKLVMPARGDAKTKPTPGRSASGAHRIYVIRKGDNYEHIARIELGSKRRHRDIASLNPNVNPERLQIGQKIKLPVK
jgi:LysM repeat protein